MDADLKDSLKNFLANSAAKCKILVVGDVMLDTYYFGEVSRISPEAPVPINHVLKTKNTLGGASNVAHNLALLGAHTSIAGYIGDDHHGQALVDLLLARGIDYFDLVHTSKPTTAKIRVIGGHQQMLRLDFEDVTPFVGIESDKLIQNISKQIDEPESLNAIIISDYGKGACTLETCQRIIKICQSKKIPVLVDPKGSNWQKYSGADFITPNLKELNDVLENPIQNVDSQIEVAARYVCKKFNIKNIIVTRSDKGLSIIQRDKISHIKARAQEVFDVSGAGDTVIATFSLAYAGGIDPQIAAYLANLAAGVVVAKIGTYAVSRDELLQALQ